VVELIDQLIDSPVLSHNLKAVATSLRSDNDIQFYTDSSLQRNSTHIDQMGLSWVVVNNKAFEFSAFAVLWPSSTKAKMLACLTALLVVPVQAKITIYTDSAATIMGFNQITEFMNLSVRKREKIPNF